MTEHPTTTWIHRKEAALQPVLTPRERKLRQSIARNRAVLHFGNVRYDTLQLLKQTMADRKMSMDQLLYFAVTRYTRAPT